MKNVLNVISKATKKAENNKRKILIDIVVSIFFEIHHTYAELILTMFSSAYELRSFFFAIFFFYLERHAKIQNRRQTPSGRKVSGRKKKKERKRKKERRTIMPSLVATTSTPARKPFVRTHYVRTNYKYNVNYIYYYCLYFYVILGSGLRKCFIV